jgi:hypothetical protein
MFSCIVDGSGKDGLWKGLLGPPFCTNGTLVAVGSCNPSVLFTLLVTVSSVLSIFTTLTTGW